MTPVESLPAAGRDLDALVAERVMGFTRTMEPWLAYGNSLNEEVWRDAQGKILTWEPTRYMPMPAGPPPYSRDIAAAWSIVEKLQPDLYLSLNVELFEGRQYVTAQFTGDRWKDSTQHYEAEADTVPLAICRAALKAVAP